jgi:integrase
MPRPSDRVYVYLMGLGGARIGEPAALRVKDFDGSVITIREAVKDSRSARLGSTKTDKVRRVPLPPWLCEEVEALAKDRLPEAWLLPSQMNQMISPHNWRGRVFDPAAKRAGLEGVRPHDLRHSASSLWAELGIPDSYRSLMLGHSLNGAGASAMTAHYTHLTPGIEEAVVTALESARPRTGDAAMSLVPT